MKYSNNPTKQVVDTTNKIKDNTKATKRDMASRIQQMEDSTRVVIGSLTKLLCTNNINNCI